MLQFPQLQIIIVLFFLAAATINDLKKREVPNWVNYGLVITGVSLSLLRSVISADWHFIAFSISGTVAALAVASLMFYTGQWGGGDSKLLVGMGAALGLPFATAVPFVGVGSQLVSFVFNLVAVSFVYAVVITGLLAFRKRARFVVELKKQWKSYVRLRRLVLAAAVLGIVIVIATSDLLVRLSVLIVLAALFSGLHLSMVAKAVEKACMIKRVSPLKLTEGDWIATDVVVAGKRIAGPKDLGVEQAQIRKLVYLYKKKKIRFVTVKEGMPFAPTFLIAFAVTAWLGNLFFRVSF